MKQSNQPFISAALSQLLEVSTSEEGEGLNIIQQYPELLTDEADMQLSLLINNLREQVAAEEIIQTLLARQTWLQEVRQMLTEEAPSLILQAHIKQAQAKYANYLKTGHQATLDAAITAWERVLNHPDFTGAEDSLRISVFNNSAGTYLRRYWVKGTLTDLDHALSCWETLITKLSSDSPHSPIILNNLSMALKHRYTHTKELIDLNQAIAVAQQAVQQTPINSPQLPNIFANLGISLHVRYHRTQEWQDLQQTIDCFQQAIQNTPDHSPELPDLFSNLGNVLHEYYTHLRIVKDLQDSIAAYQQAVNHTSIDSPELLLRLNKLQELQRYRDVFVNAKRGTIKISLSILGRSEANS